MNTLTVKFTDGETRNWLDAYWGCFGRKHNKSVGITLVGMLGRGFDRALLDDPSKFIDEVERLSGVEEVSDTEARELVHSRMMRLLESKSVPVFAPDWSDEE